MKSGTAALAYLDALNDRKTRLPHAPPQGYASRSSGSTPHWNWCHSLWHFVRPSGWATQPVQH